MSLMISLVGADSTGIAVAVPTLGAFQLSTQDTYPIVYSGVKFDADGTVYKRQAKSGWSAAGTWLFKGSAATYYLQRVISSGSLDTDAGDGVQMNADRIYDVQHTLSAGFSEADVIFEISTDAPGTTVVAGPKTYTFHAEVEGENP